jgi:hypothetical protein
MRHVNLTLILPGLTKVVLYIFLTLLQATQHHLFRSVITGFYLGWNFHYHGNKRRAFSIKKSRYRLCNGS